jgi:hypothetical protein
MSPRYYNTQINTYEDYRRVGPEDLDFSVKRDIQRYEIAQVAGTIADFGSYAMNLLEFCALSKRNPGQ